MAVTIPKSISALSDATHGEKRVFKILKELLPEEYIVWYELRVNKKYPDFIIVGPDIGLLVLEVKDWKLSSITGADTNTFALKDKNHTNPLKQARGYMIDIVNELKTDKNLVDQSGKYKGNLKFTYGHGVIFTRISRSSFESSPFNGTIDSDFILFQDDIKAIEDNNDHKLLLDKIKKMIPSKFKFNPLSENMLDRVRGNIFKEVKISTDKDAMFKVMNLNQEQYAKGLGYGHRVIRGVAGSGKTVVLSCRARFLAEIHKDWNILVLCYNKTLASYLETNIVDENIENVEVKHFHGWINEIFKNFGLNSVWDDKEVHDNLSKITDEMMNSTKKYDAILIDEGQDLEKEWLKFIVNSLRSPEHSHLLLLSDGAQNLYNREYTFKSVGIKATGRTIIMRENYRNTKQILDFAHRFLIEGMELEENNEEDNNFIINPDTSLREGKDIKLLECNDFYGEVEKIAFEIKNLLKQDFEYGDICILYPYTRYRKMNYLGLIEKILIENEIPYFPISKSSDTKSRFKMGYNNVKVSTIHSVKGLDFKVVFICGINNGMLRFSNYEKSKKLLYVGMTRAREILDVAYSVENEITNGLCNVCNGNDNVKYIENYICESNDKFEDKLNEESKLNSLSIDSENKPVQGISKIKVVNVIKSFLRFK